MRAGMSPGCSGATPSEIVFTSGATEANNLAIKGAARMAATLGDRRRRIVTLATEHHAVLDCVTDLATEGFEPVILPVGPDGLLEPAVLAEALRVPTLLVSIMAVNNEIGVIQDLPALGALVKSAGAAFHVDAAQAAGRMPLDVAESRGRSRFALGAQDVWAKRDRRAFRAAAAAHAPPAAAVRRRARAGITPRHSARADDRRHRGEAARPCQRGKASATPIGSVVRPLGFWRCCGHRSRALSSTVIRSGAWPGI